MKEKRIITLETDILIILFFMSLLTSIYLKSVYIGSFHINYLVVLFPIVTVGGCFACFLLDKRNRLIKKGDKDGK